MLTCCIDHVENDRMKKKMTEKNRKALDTTQAGREREAERGEMSLRQKQLLAE